MAAITDFLKDNVKGVGGAANLIFLPGYAKEVGEASNKMRALIKITGEWFFWTLKALAPLRSALYGGWAILGFKALGDVIKNVVTGTGSLEAALKRLQNIQMSARQLAPFVGGLGAAKQRIAELIALSSRGPFKFEELASANHSLEVYTRGAYSSAEATRTVGMQAISTGNQIGEVADAVGELYGTLREGQPIGASVERLRQMGVVSEYSAGQLVDMAKGGASSIEIFNRFSTEMENSSKSVKGLGDELTTVVSEHEKAAEALKIKFGAPWTASEIQNTKNMTAAMQAIAPAVGRVSGTFAILFNGFSTIRSSFAKAAAQSDTVRGSFEGVAKGIGYLAVLAATLGTVTLPMLIPKIFAVTAGMLTMGTAAQVAAVSLRAIGTASVIGLVLTGAVAVAGAFYNQVKASKEVEQQARNIEISFKKSNKEIKEQIANAKSLTEQHEALAKAMGMVTGAQEDLRKGQEEYNKKKKEYDKFQAPLAGGTGVAFEDTKAGKAEKAKLLALTKAAKGSKQTFAEGLQEGGALNSPEFEEAVELIRKRAFAMEEQQLQGKLSTRPGESSEILAERGSTLLNRAEQGRTGIRARAQIAEKTAGIENEKLAVQAKQEIAQKELDDLKSKPRTKESRKRIGALNEQIQGFEDINTKFSVGMFRERLQAPETTSVGASARAEALRHAIAAGAAQEAGKTKDFEKEKQFSGGQVVGAADRERARVQIAILENESKIYEMYEKEAVQIEENGKDAMRESQLRLRDREVSKETGDIELRRRIALRTGRSEEAIALKNQESFIERFERLRTQFSEPEAKKRAMAETEEDIRSRVIPGGPSAVVSSLQRIGGGGGIYAPGGDPTLQTQKQIAMLIKLSNMYLKSISGKGEGIQ